MCFAGAFASCHGTRAESLFRRVASSSQDQPKKVKHGPATTDTHIEGHVGKTHEELGQMLEDPIPGLNP